MAQGAHIQRNIAGLDGSFAIAWRTAPALTPGALPLRITEDETPASAVDEPENAFVRREWRSESRVRLPHYPPSIVPWLS